MPRNFDFQIDIKTPPITEDGVFVRNLSLLFKLKYYPT